MALRLPLPRRAMNRTNVFAIGVCLCASCGKTSAVPQASDDADASGLLEASAISDGQACGSAVAIPQAHRAVAQNCPPERGSTVPLDTTSCLDTTGMFCKSDADCTAGRNGRCFASYLSQCQSYCSYDDCLTDTDCPGKEACACRSSGASTAPNVCATDSSCRTDSDCGECGFCSPSIPPSGGPSSCSHDLSDGAVTTCGIYFSGNVGSSVLGFDLGGGACSFGASLSYACHTLNDECTNDSDCPEVGGYCAYVDAEKRWACGGCSNLPHM